MAWDQQELAFGILSEFAEAQAVAFSAADVDIDVWNKWKAREAARKAHWRWLRRDHVRQYHARYREERREAERERVRMWRTQNRDRKHAVDAAYRAAHRDAERDRKVNWMIRQSNSLSDSKAAA